MPWNALDVYKNGRPPNAVIDEVVLIRVSVSNRALLYKHRRSNSNGGTNHCFDMLPN